MHRTTPCLHWVFDMDGTLTEAVHDFDAIRAQLGLPEGEPILEQIALLPPSEQHRLHTQLFDLEMDLANQAQARDGALALLTHLHSHGVQLAILTRNAYRIALATLEAAGLRAYFHDDVVIAREHCPPKPQPDGLHLIASRWGVPSESMIMVGDNGFDVATALAAGATALHLRIDAHPAPPAHWQVHHLDILRAQCATCTAALHH